MQKILLEISSRRSLSFYKILLTLILFFVRKGRSFSQWSIPVRLEYFLLEYFFYCPGIVFSKFLAPRFFGNFNLVYIFTVRKNEPSINQPVCLPSLGETEMQGIIRWREYYIPDQRFYYFRASKACDQGFIGICSSNWSIVTFYSSETFK